MRGASFVPPRISDKADVFLAHRKLRGIAPEDPKADLAGPVVFDLSAVADVNEAQGVPDHKLCPARLAVVAVPDGLVQVLVSEVEERLA